MPCLASSPITSVRHQHSLLIRSVNALKTLAGVAADQHADRMQNP
jgi:hypothetical protein